MDANEAARQLATIRRIMESATQLTVLPGWAAIAGGVLALAGSAATYGLAGSLDFGAVGRVEAGTRAAIVAIWAGVGLGGIILDVALTIRLARRRGKKPWSRLSQLAAYAMGPALAAALAITISLILRGLWAPVPAIWMLLYGVAVWMTGILSVRAPSLLGLAFMAAGVATLFGAESISLVMVAVTFGLAHIAFGAYLLARFGD